MHHARDSGAFGRLNKGPGVVDGFVKCGAAARETDPVSVDETRSAPKGAFEFVGIPEVVREDFDCIAKFIFALRMKRKGTDAKAAVEQQAGYVFSRVAESAGNDYVFVGHTCQTNRPI